MLKFLGVGSAFNTELGNNSAFIKEGDHLLLIDCGGSIFHRLRKNELLDGVKHLTILITHPHPDHVGSLGDLIFYSYYVLKITPHIYFPKAKWLASLLTSLGVAKDKYVLSDEINPIIVDPRWGGILVSFQPATHSQAIPCYGFYLTQGAYTIYYSGDASEIPSAVLEQLEKGELAYLYQDTSGQDYPENPHLSLEKLIHLIPLHLRKGVFCMHLDPGFPREKAIKSGFQVAEVYDSTT